MLLKQKLSEFPPGRTTITYKRPLLRHKFDFKLQNIVFFACSRRKKSILNRLFCLRDRFTGFILANMAPNFENDLLLVIGASGRVASTFLPQLSQKWKRLRLACKSASSSEKLAKLYPTAEVVTVDLTVPSACRALFVGVATVFHIGPPYHPRETDIGINMIDAAVEESKVPGNNFQHFIYSSVLQSLFRKMLNHDRKRYVEEHLMESDLNWTIVQPSHMMDSMAPTILDAVASKETEFKVEADFTYTTRFANVMLKDLGEGIAAIINQRETHYFGLYPFVSMESPMSYQEMWAAVGKIIGKTINLEQQSLDVAIGGLGTRLFRDAQQMNLDVLKAAERTLLFYNRKGLIGNPNVLAMILGRKTTSFEEWVKDVIASK